MKKGGTSTVHRRVNITLPEETLDLIDRSADKGDRSRFINEAVKYFITRKGRQNLRQLLREGGAKRATRDLAIAEEWFKVSADTWSEE